MNEDETALRDGPPTVEMAETSLVDPPSTTSDAVEMRLPETVDGSNDHDTPLLVDSCAKPCGCHFQVEQSVKLRGVMLHVPLPIWKWVLVLTNLPFFLIPVFFLTEPSSTTDMSVDRVVVSLLVLMCGLISMYFHGIQCFLSPTGEKCRTALLLDMTVCGGSAIVLFAMLIAKGLFGEFLVQFWWLMVVSVVCISPQFSILFKICSCLPTPDGLMYTVTHSLWHVFASLLLCAISRAIVVQEVQPFGVRMFMQ
jgi:hypothetical protein